MSETDKKLKMRGLGLEASYLAACALHDTVPVLPEEPDWEALYRFCKFHSITSIVAMALEQVWKEHPADPEVMRKWRQARDKAIRKNMLLNAERERLLAYLESIGCWYMPLKGSLLQFDYPKFGMRQMSDNDILVDRSKLEQIRGFMCQSGYEVLTYGEGNHDEYAKKPVYHFEIHWDLFKAGQNPVLDDYYRDVKSRLVKDAENGFGYHFSANDFYIFMVTHAYKHYLHGGLGIRNLLDPYVFINRHGDALDWCHLEKELRKLGTWEFDQKCRTLGNQLLNEPSHSVQLSVAQQLELDSYFLSLEADKVSILDLGRLLLDSARHRDGMDSDIAGGRVNYVWKRLFPSVNYLAEKYPILNEKRWLTPFYYLKRLGNMLFSRRKYVLREIRNILKLK